MAAYLENIEFLVVDDNAGMRMVIKNVLHALQVKRIKEADNGETAFDIVRTTPPDIILSDWEMSPVDGLEFTRMIRNSEQSPNPFLPVIMVSGYAQRGRVLAARDAGVTEFVVKPISAKTLFSRVRAVIESPRPFVRTKTFFGPDRRRSKIDYDGPERRGEEAKTVAPPPPDQVISQDEINVLFNPDTEGEDGEDAKTN